MLVLYDLPTTDIENALFWAITDENRLDQKEFKSACHDIFQAKQTSKVKLVTKQDVETMGDQNQKTETDVEAGSIRSNARRYLTEAIVRGLIRWE
ncbi:hypothetical protein [Radiobacillus deserti]|uniref:hypothetical protein n=1 Tax=Radiobacillus deserti TaxID=2594883 RepID=UPI001E63FE68|nr:hypothetical protein [Radiobacillus deserti]